MGKRCKQLHGLWIVQYPTPRTAWMFAWAQLPVLEWGEGGVSREVCFVNHVLNCPKGMTCVSKPTAEPFANLS